MTSRTSWKALAVLAVAGALTWQADARGQYYSRPNSNSSNGYSTAHNIKKLQKARDADVRADAAEALGRLGDPSAISALSQAALYDRDREVRRAADKAITRIRRGGGGGDRWDGGGGWFPPTPAPVDPHAEMVQGWYNAFLGRSCGPTQLEAMVNQLKRGVSAQAVQAQIFSSAEYWNRAAGEATTFVRHLYLNVLSREPAAGEVQIWVNRFAVLRGDRARLVQDFVTAAQTELAERQSGFVDGY